MSILKAKDEADLAAMGYQIDPDNPNQVIRLEPGPDVATMSAPEQIAWVRAKHQEYGGLERNVRGLAWDIGEALRIIRLRPEHQPGGEHYLEWGEWCKTVLGIPKSSRCWYQRIRERNNTREKCLGHKNMLEAAGYADPVDYEPLVFPERRERPHEEPPEESTPEVEEIEPEAETEPEEPEAEEEEPDEEVDEEVDEIEAAEAPQVEEREYEVRYTVNVVARVVASTPEEAEREIHWTLPSFPYAEYSTETAVISVREYHEEVAVAVANWQQEGF